MMNNGIVFGDQGPLMEGTWYNPTTGDSFTVRDSFFEDGQYMVTTTDGRMIGYNMIQNYIKSDKPIHTQKKTEPKSEELPTSVLNELASENDELDILPEDQIIFSNPTPKSLGNINSQPTSPVEASNTSIISKALGKATKPTVVADVTWTDFPKKQIEMLSEIMEIDMKEIVEWYASQLDTTEIAIAIHNSLVQYINNQLYGDLISLECVVSVSDFEPDGFKNIEKVSKINVTEAKQKTTKKLKETKPKTTKKTKK